MSNIIFVNDVVLEDGKTIKETNLQKQHSIALGSLVEIKSDDYSDCSPVDQHSGLRLFITEHTRDCDGTPLYSLSFNKIAAQEFTEAKKALVNAEQGSLDHTVISWNVNYLKGSILTGFSEESLTVIKISSV